MMGDDPVIILRGQQLSTEHETFTNPCTTDYFLTFRLIKYCILLLSAEVYSTCMGGLCMHLQ